MSKGEWRRCPYTRIPLKTLARVSECYLTNEGFFRINLLPDCNLFGMRSISAACGFQDHNYFRRSVLKHPNCPIHVRRMTLVDEETGAELIEIIATHQNSATYGGNMWHARRSAAARDRAFASRFDTSSGSIV